MLVSSNTPGKHTSSPESLVSIPRDKFIYFPPDLPLHPYLPKPLSALSLMIQHPLGNNDIIHSGLLDQKYYTSKHLDQIANIFIQLSYTNATVIRCM